MIAALTLVSCSTPPPPDLHLYEGDNHSFLVNLEPDGTLHSTRSGDLLGTYAEGVIRWADGTSAPVDRSAERPVVVGADFRVTCRGTPCGRVDPWDGDDGRLLALVDAGRRDGVFAGPGAMMHLTVDHANTLCRVDARLDGRLAPNEHYPNEPEECRFDGTWDDTAITLRGVTTPTAQVIDEVECRIRRHGLPPLTKDTMYQPNHYRWGSLAAHHVTGHLLVMTSVELDARDASDAPCADPAARAALAAAGLALDAAWTRAQLPEARH